MTDFERRVTEALEAGAEEAPDATGLLAGARRRARNRRRVRVGAVAGLVVIAVAVPVGVASLGGDAPADSGRVAEDPATSEAVTPDASTGPTVPAGWKVEHWNGLAVAVPGDWESGTRSSWCAGGRPEEARVERPDSMGVSIACTDPAYSFGLSFGSSATFDPVYSSGHVWRYTIGDAPDVVEQYVPGSWLGYWYDETRLVQVNAGDRETVRQIMDSISNTADAPGLIPGG